MTSRGIYLQWEGKRVYRQRIPTPRMLEPVAKLSVGNTEENRIVEGDSLQVMGVSYGIPLPLKSATSPTFYPDFLW